MNKDFIFFKDFLSGDNYKEIIDYLKNTKDFKNNPKCSNNNRSGRLQKWFQIDRKYFCPKWETRLDWWQSFEYDNTLLNNQNLIQSKLNELNFKVNINSCLINYYRDGNDYIAPHRDSKLSFGSNPIIAIYSIGQTRTLRFKKRHENYKDSRLTKKHKDNTIIDFKLPDNSLFIMMNDSQTSYSHELIKDDSKNPRFSLTYREFIL